MGSISERSNARTVADVPQLGRYRVCYRIAQGGMASVYLARLDTTAGFSKWVALKVIHPNIANDEKFVAMFLDEARLAAKLDHPNLCTVFDFGTEDGTYYIAMEYLHGETLGTVARKAWSTQGSLPLELGVRAVADAARGLHAAHELRADDNTLIHVVHRDVSPENVFVTYTGIAKLVDFGVARSNHHSHDRTATGELKGKLAYMSPEQLQEKRVDRRTDVWALGVVLWEISVGRRLFRRQTDAQTVFAITRDPITPPSRLRDDYPPVLEALVMRALERDPVKRFQTAQEFCRALEGWLNSTGRPAGVSEVGEFMQLLFAEQMVWRDQYLRKPDAVFEDLVAQWTASPRRSIDIADANTVAMGLGIVDPRASHDPAFAVLDSPPRPSRTPIVPDDPDATCRAMPLKYDLPVESEVIPLTRRAPIHAPQTPVPVYAGQIIPAVPGLSLTPVPPIPGRAAEDLRAASHKMLVGRQTPQAPALPVASKATSEPHVSHAPGSAQRPQRNSSLPIGPKPNQSGSSLRTIATVSLLGVVCATIWMDNTARPVRRPPSHTPTSTAVLAQRLRATAAPSPQQDTITAQPTTPPLPVVPPVASPTLHGSTAASSDVPRVPARLSNTSHHSSSSSSSTRSPYSDEASPDGDLREPGFLNVTTNSPAEIFIGARSLGHAPLVRASLAPGLYVLRVVPESGATERQALVTIRSGQVHTTSVAIPASQIGP
jgi:eukaryotic-like serine/threonine-protein kinase